MGIKLWIDDVRPAPDESWDVVATSDAAIAFLNLMVKHVRMERIDVISFDHDLGGDDTARPVVIWMIENNVRATEYRIHSANPVGRDWLTGMIERYLR